MDAKPQKKQRPKSLYEQAKENEVVGSEYIEVVPAQGNIYFFTLLYNRMVKSNEN